MNLTFIKEVFNKFWSSGPVHTSIRKTFKYQFKKFFLASDPSLFFYSEQIIVLSVFLLISSSFMSRKNEDDDFDFDWKSYLSIFKPKHMRDFILCSIRYLIDSGKIEEREKRKILEIWREDLKDSFLEQYMSAFVHRKTKEFNSNINFGQYTEALDLVLKINNVYCEEIPKDSSKVLDLVDYTTVWKTKMFELFDKKSEYIVFSFFVNLSSR